MLHGKSFKQNISRNLIYAYAKTLRMLFFAHVGLTLASARILPRASMSFIALGSMLPDIIDKPLGILVFGSASMGRTIAHTLLFLLLFVSLSLYIRDIRIRSLCWGVFIHQILDSMWSSPKILLWPLLGSFPAVPLLDTWSYLDMLLHGLENPNILIPEISGLAYLIYLGYKKNRVHHPLLRSISKKQERKP